MVKIHVDKVVNDLYVLRVDDDRVRYFEALWYIPEGITYNAYLLASEDRIVLFDTWKHVYADLFVDTLRNIVEPNSIDFIVLHHLEPDHSGSLPKLLEANKYQATILAHPLAKNMIESFYGISPKFKPLRDGESLNVGKYNLRFTYTPWLHWPETIMTYISELKTLLTCDAFGGFSIPPTLYDIDEDFIREYLDYAKKYVITIVGHYKDYIVKNIDKLISQELDIRVIAPAHGLIWKQNPKLILEKYREWALGEPIDRKVVVIYSSMYGFVENAISILVDELVKNGIKVRIHRFNDTEYSSLADVLSDIVDASAIVLGMATYEADIFPYMDYVIAEMVKKASFRKPVVIVSSYGWGGIAGKKVSNTLNSAGYEVIDVVEFKGLVKEDTRESLKNAARKLVERLKA